MQNRALWARQCQCEKLGIAVITVALYLYTAFAVWRQRVNGSQPVPVWLTDNNPHTVVKSC